MSNLRITGLATGIDTDQVVRDLMRVESTRVDRVQQDKQILQWRQELYNSVNKDFANFILNTKKEFGLTGTTSTGAMYNKTLSSLSWVKRAISSNENVVKVSTTSTATNGNYEIKIDRLADGVKAASRSNISIGDKSNLAAQFGLEENDTIEFSITTGEGKTVKFAFGENVDLDAGTVGITGKKLSEIKLSDVVKVINSATTEDGKKLGIQASYDSNIDRFFLQTTETGAKSILQIDANDTNSKGKTFIDALKLNVTSYYKDADSDDWESLTNELETGTEYKGVDALLSFNGATGIEQPSNQFTINGINFEVKNTGTVNVTVDTDVDAALDKIKKFVEQYNEIVDKMDKLLSEREYRDFRPLTAEQKESMKEKEIELWEEKAKSGLLRNDSIISSTMQKVRRSLYEQVQGVDGPYKALFDIGITTERWAAGTAGGRLQIDEESLRKALSEDVEGVLELLFKEAGPLEEVDGSGNPIQGKGGVITRMYDTMIDGMKEVINKAGPGEDSSLFRNIRSNMLIDFVTKHGSISMLDKDISKLDLRIEDLNAFLARKEDQYYSRFAAMEKYIQQMNSQSSWLMQQLGMGY